MLMVDCACALAYARWRAVAEPGWRIVGSLEREKAGRGADGRFFPWGDAYDPSWVCNGRSHEHHPLPQVVDSFPTDVSVYGVRGLGGNVRDWCAELRTDAGAPVQDGRVVGPVPEVDPDMRPKARRVTRGGYWTSVPRNARCANRSADAPGNRLADLGIRLARSL
jgi:serine/threonine-protein kinase